MKKIIVLLMLCFVNHSIFSMEGPTEELASQLQKLRATLQPAQPVQEPSTSMPSSSRRTSPPPLVPDDEDEPSTSPRVYNYETLEEGQESLLTMPEEVLWNIIKEAILNEDPEIKELRRKEGLPPLEKDILTQSEFIQALKTLTNLSLTNKQLYNFMNNNVDRLANYLKHFHRIIAQMIHNPSRHIRNMDSWYTMIKEHQNEWSGPVKRIIQRITDEAKIIRAVENGDWDQVETLLTLHHFDPDIFNLFNDRLLIYALKTTESPEPIQMLLEHHASPNFIPLLDYDSPLNIAISAHNIPAIKLLLNSEANINDPRTRPILLTALESYWPNDPNILRILQLLLDNGADTKVTDSGDGSTLLHIAVIAASDPFFQSEQSNEIISKLIEYGAPINQANNDGMTPLDLAIQQDDEGLIKLLQDKGADIDTPDHLGQTALMRAAQKGDNELVEALLRYGANINAQDNAGLTPLMHAIINDRSRIVEVLLARNDINLGLQDKLGRTTLQIAEKYKRDRMIIDIKKKHGTFYSEILEGK